MSGTIHVVNAFESAMRGSERAALAAARRLANCAAVTVWSTGQVPTAVSVLARSFDIELQVIQPFGGRFPRDGTLLLWGTHFEPGLWLAACRCERVLVVGELFRNAGLYRNLLAVRSAGLPEPSIIYVSSLLRDSALLPGAVLSPLPDLASMFGVERDPHPPRVTVGRVSRDVPEKHHADDPLLYRGLIADGLGVRILGGTAIAGAMPDDPAVELLPQGSQAVDAFLRRIDVFFYRTRGPGILVESSGLAVAEAMAAGLPVVAGRPGGFEDLIADGENGYLVDTQDQAYEAISRLAGDAELRARIGGAARAAMIERFGGGYERRLMDIVSGVGAEH